MKPIEALLLSAVMIVLFLLSGLVLYNAGTALFHVVQVLYTPEPGSKVVFARLVTKVVSAALLVVIAMELLETVRQQITNDERLTLQLVHNFLVIGIVSAIRHLLAVGAELSLGVPGALEESLRVLLLWELAANALVVGVLLGGLRLVDQWKSSHAEPKNAHEQIDLSQTVDVSEKPAHA